MNYMVDEHPNDDMLTTYAIDSKEGDISTHIQSCPSCSRYVKEIRAIKDSLQVLPDEEAPEKLRGTILKTINSKHSILNSWLNFAWTNWFRNPFIIGIGIIWVIIFLYIFIVFVL
jgi:hypothetical protein